MNAGLAQAWRDAAETFDRVTWTTGDSQTPRVLSTHVWSLTGRRSQMPLNAEDSAQEFHRALGIALMVIAELNAALLATQDVAGAVIDRAIEAENGP